MASSVQRVCCVCRIKQQTDGMTRVVKMRGENGGYVFAVDKNHKLNGRGCHVCPNCLDKAIKTKALNRSFKTAVDDAVYKELAANIKA